MTRRPPIDPRVALVERRIPRPQDRPRLHLTESLTGRELARSAMQTLEDRGSIPPDTAGLPVLRGERGEPIFPDGVVGSISHSRGVVAVAAASRHDGVITVGIDVHPARRPTSAVAALVATADEVRTAPLARRRLAPALIFSAKESVFKAWYPLTGHWLEYGDIEIRLKESTFEFTVPVAAAAGTGWWWRSRGFLHTLVVA